MAIGMKSWLGLVFGGMTLIALAKLPPEPPGLPGALEELPEQARLRELGREMRITEGVLRRRALSDSLAPLVASAGPGAVVADGRAESTIRPRGPAAPLADDGARDLLRDAVERALGRAPRRAAIGVFLLPRRADSPMLQDTYMGSLDGIPYCLRVISGTGRVGTGTLRTSDGVDVLGVCRFAARHGLPGPHILTWLKSGGIGFAQATSDDVLRPPPGHGTRALVEIRGTALSLVPDRCLAGVAEACAVAFLDPRTAENMTTEEALVIAASPLIGGRGSRFASVFGAADDYLLADLEGAFGPERFSRFWQSRTEVRTAFENAFETSLGPWVMGWTRENIGGSDRAGPGLPRGALAGTLVVMLLSGLAVTAVTKRRQVA